MSGRADVVVVGGGIAGLTTALALAELGARVTIADEWRPGAASRASAGILAAGLGFPPAVMAAAEAAREAYVTIVEHLRATTGITVPLDRRGIIEVPGDDEPPDANRTSIMLEGEALSALEPALASHPRARLFPRDGAVEPVPLMDALDAAMDAQPRIARARVAIVAIRPGDTGFRMETSDRGRLAAARVVLAAGAWAASMDGLPRTLPIRPVLGELLLLPAARPLGHVVYGAGGYLVPRRDGILVGATSEDRGFDVRTSEAGRASLLTIAERLMPSLDGLPVLGHWAGLRPVSADGLPILGADPEQPGLSYACGLSRNGILFAPWAAGQVAREVAGERCAALDPFRVDRFGGCGAAVRD